MDLMMMERVGDRWEKTEGSCSTGQSPQWAVVPVEEEEENGNLQKQTKALIGKSQGKEQLGSIYLNWKTILK
jgi:hypothetical protein